MKDILEQFTSPIVIFKNTKLHYCSDSFLSLVDSKDKEEVLDITKFFVSKKGYICFDDCNYHIIEYIKQLPYKDRKVIIKDVKLKEDKVFYITLKQKNEFSFLQFSDITNVENHYKLLMDTVCTFEKANEIEIVKRFRLEQEKVEQERVIIQQSKMAEIGEMIGVITHQWKQPLNVLSVKHQEIEMLFEEGRLRQEDMEHFGVTTKKQIKFMSKTIDDFRNFFNPNKQKEPFCVKKAIENIVSILEYEFKIHSICVSISGESRRIFGVENEFKQVVLNFLNNTKDAVLPKLQKDDSFLGTILISIYEKDNRVVIEFCDNAGGISENIIENIFDAYFTTKAAKGGDGIGLHISKTIIEKNFGGELSVENIKDGAKFTIKIDKYKESDE